MSAALKPDFEPTETTLAEMEALLARQRASFLADGPPSAGMRIDRIERAIDLLIRHQKELCEAVSLDFGHRSSHQTQITDIYGSIEPLKFAKKNVRSWMRNEKRAAAFPLNAAGAKARIEHQPLGVVGVIAPWNFPIFLSFAPLAGIFAAGNRVILKPSELTPRTSALMQHLIHQAYDETEAAVVTGGVGVGSAFSGLPFDHLLFTGSTSVAKHVMRAASENLVPVTLELGGKSPVVVSRSADMDMVCDRVINGKMLNAGQICLAPDYVFVPEGQVEAFVAGAVGVVEQRYPALADNPDYTSIVSERHHARLMAMVQDARDKGGRVVEVNPSNESFEGGCGRKMPLYLVLEPTDDMLVMQDELFGPILPVRSYVTMDEVIGYVNARPRPLALYYFGNDKREQDKLLSRTTAGGVTINDVIMHVACEDLPFGGVGPSGMGTYHGREGFLAFSHQKSVLVQSKLDVMGVMRPPYGALLERTLKLFIRR